MPKTAPRSWPPPADYGAEVLYNYQSLNAVALKSRRTKAWTKPSAISPRCPAYWPPIATKVTVCILCSR